MLKFLLPAFILFPLIEIYLLIKMGDALGAGMTLLLILLTAAIGAWLVRAQGFTVITRAHRRHAAGRSPAAEAIEGVVLFFAGTLLLAPGFFTDAIGFAMLLPPLRRKITSRLLARTTFTPPNSGRVIDADYERID